MLKGAAWNKIPVVLDGCHDTVIESPSGSSKRLSVRVMSTDSPAFTVTGASSFKRYGGFSSLTLMLTVIEGTTMSEVKPLVGSYKLYLKRPETALVIAFKIVTERIFVVLSK